MEFKNKHKNRDSFTEVLTEIMREYYAEGVASVLQPGITPTTEASGVTSVLSKDSSSDAMKPEFCECPEEWFNYARGHCGGCGTPRIQMEDFHLWKASEDVCQCCGITGNEYNSFNKPRCPNSAFTSRSCCGGSGHIRWSGDEKQWKCTDCGSIKSNDPNYYWSPKDSPEKVYPTWSKSPKCECGGTTAKTTHAHWCPIKN